LNQAPGLWGTAVDREKAGPSLSQVPSPLQVDDRAWIEVWGGLYSCSRLYRLVRATGSHLLRCLAVPRWPGCSQRKSALILPDCQCCFHNLAVLLQMQPVRRVDGTEDARQINNNCQVYPLTATRKSSNSPRSALLQELRAASIAGARDNLRIFGGIQGLGDKVDSAVSDILTFSVH